MQEKWFVSTNKMEDGGRSDKSADGRKRKGTPGKSEAKRSRGATGGKESQDTEADRSV